MAWVNQHRRVWLALLVILWLGALSGPWGFDVIHVPAEYGCTTAIRLDGDFCGLPFSGFWALSWITQAALTLPAALISEPTRLDQLLREVLFFGLALLLFSGPFINLLLLITGTGGWRGRIIHAGAWSLAAGYGLLLGTHGFVRPYWALWGIWSYLGIALSVLVLELLGWAAGRRRPGAFARPTPTSVAQ
jgi:hypothetical protein